MHSINYSLPIEAFDLPTLTVGEVNNIKVKNTGISGEEIHGSD